MNSNPLKNQINWSVPRGPFRGLIITYNEDINLMEFQKIYNEITFQNQNFCFSHNDKHKHIIYYKYPYVVASIIEKYKTCKSFKMEIYQDNLTKFLCPDILFLKKLKMTAYLHHSIQQLEGQIIQEKKENVLIRFNSFHLAAIAQENLRITYNVKFAYKSEVPTIKNGKDQDQDQDQKKKDKKQIKKDIKDILDKFDSSQMQEVTRDVGEQELHIDVNKLLKKYKKYVEPQQKKKVTWNQTSSHKGSTKKCNEDCESVTSDTSISHYVTLLKEFQEDI